MWRKVFVAAGFAGLILLILLSISILLQRDLPSPGGPLTVGRTSQIWVDGSRQEALSENGNDVRQVPVEIWYPAEAGTGTQAPYFPNLERLASDLAASGEVSVAEVYALRYARNNERRDANLSDTSSVYPVVIFSPGNGTNVEFYASIAGELASHGYIVVGLNHPYDVVAVALQDGSIVRFIPGPFPIPEHEAWVAERVAVRTQDILFALEQLEKLNTDETGRFTQHLDLARVAVMGHSLGGISAAQACRNNPQFRACLNIDGLQRGGPFSTSENPSPPDQPFMMITKEKQLPPASIALFEAIPSGGYRVVITDANHESFTDGAVLMLSLLPLPNRADRILALFRSYTLAFLEQTLNGQPSPLLEKSMQEKSALVEVYPPQR